MGERIIFRGNNLLEYFMERMRREIIGKQISMIFQDPTTSLNPVFTVINQITEAIRLHRIRARAKAYQLGIEMMKKVGIPFF